MILSKTNLQAVSITKDDKQIPALNNIYVCKDGSTVASNGNVILCVSPITKEVKENTVVEDIGNAGEATIPAELAADVLKNIPADRVFKGLLEHCNFNVEDSKGVFTIKDGRKTRNIAGALYRHGYIPFKKILRKALRCGTGNRVILNLQRLLSLLTTINKMCPDSSGDSPVFLEFTEDNDIIVKTVNRLNGQRVLGVMKSYKTDDETGSEEDKWEKSLTTKQKEV